MRTLRIGVAVWLVCTGLAAAQTPPQLIPFNGIALDVTGQPPASVVAITFAVYEEPLQPYLLLERCKFPIGRLATSHLERC